MMILDISQKTADLRLSPEELTILKNSLQTVCVALPKRGFPTTIGAYDDVVDLCEALVAVVRTIDKLSLP